MTEPPTDCAVAFKEWAGVCAAIADGRQSLILRKGGIAEGPGGFRPEHPAFWLYPTHLHEAQQGLRDGAVEPPASETPAGMVDLPALVTVEAVAWVDEIEKLGPLADQHVWSDETVAKRFHYRRPGVWVLGVRAYRAEPPRRIAATPEHAGCKSWVPLDEAIGTEGLAAVLDEAEAEARLAAVRGLADGGGS